MRQMNQTLSFYSGGERNIWKRDVHYMLTRLGIFKDA